jgi:hypothetical protein
VSSPWATAASAVEAELVEQLLGAIGKRDPAGLRVRLDVIPDLVDVCELGADAAKIVPDAGENDVDLLGRLLREGFGEIVAADPLLAEARADPLRDPPEQVGGLDRIEIARGAQHADRECAHGGCAERFRGLTQSGLGLGEQSHVGRKAIRPVRGSE